MKICAADVYWEKHEAEYQNFTLIFRKYFPSLQAKAGRAFSKVAPVITD